MCSISEKKKNNNNNNKLMEPLKCNPENNVKQNLVQIKL